MHDSRIGRFFSVDPLSGLFSWNSSYAFSENRVVDGIELEGAEVYLKTLEPVKHTDTETKVEYAEKVVNNVLTHAYNGFVGIWNYAGDLTNPEDIWDLQFGKDKLVSDGSQIVQGFGDIWEYYSTDSMAGKMFVASLKHEFKNFSTEDFEKAMGESIDFFSVTKIGKLKKLKWSIDDPNIVSNGISFNSLSNKGKLGKGLTGSNWTFNPAKDIDLRGTGASYKDALDKAFELTGLSKDQFTVTKWSTNKGLNGKSLPVEWQGPNGANVNIDIPAWNNVKPNGKLGEGPHQPHIGYQTSGKGKNRKRGHIFTDDITISR